MDKLNDRQIQASAALLIAFKQFWNGAPQYDVANARALLPAWQEFEMALQDEEYIEPEPEAPVEPAPAPPPVPVADVSPAGSDSELPPAPTVTSATTTPPPPEEPLAAASTAK